MILHGLDIAEVQTAGLLIAKAHAEHQGKSHLLAGLRRIPQDRLRNQEFLFDRKGFPQPDQFFFKASGAGLRFRDGIAGTKQHILTDPLFCRLLCDAFSSRLKSWIRGAEYARPPRPPV